MKGTGTARYQNLFFVLFSPSFTYGIKGKGKAVPVHSIKAYGEQKYSSTLSSTSNLMEMSGQLHDTATSPLVPTEREAVCVAVLETRKT
jgi:hypothetical protein